MRKFFREIHKWLSIPVGVIIAVICLTGCILVFDDEILEAFHHDRYFVENNTQKSPMALSELIPKVDAQLDTNTVASVRISNDPQRAYVMSLKKGFRVSAYVDQYTGEVKEVVPLRDTFMFKVMSLHRWLMDGSRTWGKYTVGISTLIFVVILISGVVIWFPKNRKKMGSRLKVKWSAGKKRLYYDLHSVLGVYACLILLVCALTGLMWSFEWYRDSVFTLFGTGVEKKEESPRGGGRGGRGGDKPEKQLNVSQWDKALAEVKRTVPEFDAVMVEDGSITVKPKSAVHGRVTDKYEFSGETGAITAHQPYLDTPLNTRIFHWAYALHVGDWGSGYWAKILTCIAVLIGGSLPITGYYLYFTKNRKKKRR